MKTIKKFNTLIFTLFAVLILSFTAKVNSQVIVKLQYPPPNQVNIEDVWKLQLITNTTENLYHVYLYGTVTNDDNGDLIWEGNSSVFNLTANYSGPIEPSDLDPVSGKFNSKYDKIKEIAIRTGTLPAGNYAFCITVINADAGEEGGELGKDCIQVSVAHPSPPELISPQDGAVIEEDYPIFTWMSPMPIPLGEMITYHLIIYELHDGQTKEEAMQSNPVWFEEKDITSTSFQYPVSARNFEMGGRYAWQIICFMDPNLSNGLKSEVWSFEYKYETVQHKLKLLTPEFAKEIEDSYPLFSWSISDNLENYDNTNYTLKIFEVDTSSQPIDYSKEKPFYEKNKIRDNFYKYSEKDRPLNEGKAYVWWVETNTRNRIIRPDTAYIIFWRYHLYDYGDAPDVRPALSSSPYPTYKNHNGARHYWLTIYWHRWPYLYFPYTMVLPRAIGIRTVIHLEEAWRKYSVPIW